MENEEFNEEFDKLPLESQVSDETHKDKEES